MRVWDGRSLHQLLSLQQIGPTLWRASTIDMNSNGRAYGGQTLAQAMVAACETVDGGRLPSAMQLMFLAGVKPETPVDWEVTTLQEGKRFSSRHVRASQGDRLVADAQISFGEPSPGLHHQARVQPICPDPLNALPLSALPPEWRVRTQMVGGYSFKEKNGLEFRLPDPEGQLFAPTGTHRVEFWLRANHATPATPHWRASVLAYLSDWWLNFSSLVGHLDSLKSSKGLYSASLNHALWFYGDCDPSAWMLFVSESPRTGGSRGLSVANIYSQSLELMVVAAQECLMTELAA